MNSRQKELMNEAIYRIVNEEKFNKSLKERFADYPLCEYKVYDRNLAMRVMFNNVKSGGGTGNCKEETTKYYMKHFCPHNHRTPNIQLCRGHLLGGLDQIIYHYYILFQDNDKFYYLSHSNGIHKIVPFFTQQDAVIDIQIASFVFKGKKIKTFWEDYYYDDGLLKPCHKGSVTRFKTRVKLMDKCSKRKNKQ